MVNIKKAIMITACFLILMGCQSIFQSKKNLDGSPYDYTINEEEDLVIKLSGASDRMKLDAFMKKGEGMQRIIHYTDEGDPIYYDLMFESEGGIKLRYDNTKDSFGSPRVDTYSCKELQMEETDKELTYKVVGCGGDQQEFMLLYISYDVEEQDKFEFSLKYGVGQKNEINTMEKKLVKDLVIDGVAEVKDFEFTKEERALIYKKMVLANFLTEKHFTNGCKQKPSGPYTLKIQINSKTLDYTWENCESSKDGLVMTELVNEIIEIVRAKDEYKSLPPASGAYE